MAETFSQRVRILEKEIKQYKKDIQRSGREASGDNNKHQKGSNKPIENGTKESNHHIDKAFMK